ncbi:MAG: hypothetical protein ACRDV2_04235 [Actinomycetes bacterium]
MAQVGERHTLAGIGWDWQWWAREVLVDDGERIEIRGRAPGE